MINVNKLSLKALEENIGVNISGAVFDQERRFRFALWRIWDKTRTPLLFVGLNPSKASETRDDPTIRRVIGFAKRDGYGGLFVGNLSPFVSTTPHLNFTRPTFNRINLAAIKRMHELSAGTLAGWGFYGAAAGDKIAACLDLVGKPVFCLGKTQEGEPLHPLYIRADTPFQIYERGTNEPEGSDTDYE